MLNKNTKQGERMKMQYDRYLARFIPKIKFQIRELDREKLTLEMHPNVNVGWRKDRLEIVKKELNQLKERA